MPSMAGQHCKAKNGARGSGGSHSDYIAGYGRFADRNDVVYCADFNMPSWAKDGTDFFKACDEHERGDYTRKCKTKDGQPYEKHIKGRAYKEFEIAIPREAADPVKWAQDFARETLGDKHAYRVAVHDTPADDGGRNIHMHLMFSTRELDGVERDRATFFKRAASAYRDRKTKELVPADPAKGGAKKSDYWNSPKGVEDTRARFERHVQRDVPGFKLTKSDAPEMKIGPKLKKAGPEYEQQRAERAQSVRQLRGMKAERQQLAVEIRKIEAADRALESVRQHWRMPPEVAKRQAMGHHLAAQVRHQVEPTPTPRPEPKPAPKPEPKPEPKRRDYRRNDDGPSYS